MLFAIVNRGEAIHKKDLDIFRFRDREFETFIRAVYYLLYSIARETSLEIREFTLPGPGPCWQAQDQRGI